MLPRNLNRLSSRCSAKRIQKSPTKVNGKTPLPLYSRKPIIVKIWSPDLLSRPLFSTSKMKRVRHINIASSRRVRRTRSTIRRKQTGESIPTSTMTRNVITKNLLTCRMAKQFTEKEPTKTSQKFLYLMEKLTDSRVIKLLLKSVPVKHLWTETSR